MPDDQELKAFKTQIDLRSYAAAQHGYTLDRTESWLGSSVMRDEANDKIVIKRDADGHYVYFSIRDAGDNGSLIDFVQRRQPNLNLGAVRKLLRPWIGKSRGSVTPALPIFPALPITTKNRFDVETALRHMRPAGVHPYLEAERRIPTHVLASARFAGRVRADSLGNAVFPHFDQEGLCGYEIKNKGFTGFAKGGTKGLWFSHALANDNRLVFCESAIDALSYAALFPAPGARYASIGGHLSPSQPELICAALKRLPVAFTVVAATDADSEGQKMANLIRQTAATLSPKHRLVFTRHAPAGFKDWNEELQARSACLFPTAPSE